MVSFSTLLRRQTQDIGREMINKSTKSIEKQMKKSLMLGEINSLQYLDLTALLNDISQYDLLVGIPDSSNARRNGSITNSELAYIQTHGVVTNKARQEIEENISKDLEGKRGEVYRLYIQSHGSPAFRIPPRPIIEPALEFHSDKINEELSNVLSKFLEGDLARGEKSLKRLGMKCQNFVRDWFTNPNNKWAPNSPSTIKKKGSANPLIDTGDLRKSITYVVNIPKGKSRIFKKIKNKERLNR